MAKSGIKGKKVGGMKVISGPAPVKATSGEGRGGGKAKPPGGHSASAGSSSKNASRQSSGSHGRDAGEDEEEGMDAGQGQESEKLTKQQRRDRNKLQKLLAEQAAAREQGINMSLKDHQMAKKSSKQQAQALAGAQARFQQAAAADEEDGGGGGNAAVPVGRAGSGSGSSAAAHAPSKGGPHSSQLTPAAASLPAAKRKADMPPPCPKELQLKENDRFMTPADAAYTRVMQQCYGGCVVQPPEEFPDKFHHRFRMAMEGLDAEGMYQFDLTQPMGLGTKVARTFVTRCLVGEAGCTYKYLGLRMFSYPWTEGQVGASAYTVQIGRLNQDLVKRSKALLRASGKAQYGSCEFNLTLINRCFPDGEVVQLKDEPLFKKEKCTVSWHSDSTLQHYSTIAVYHCTKPVQGSSSSSGKSGDSMDEAEAEAGAGAGDSKDKDESWRIALRQAPNSEGPNAGKASRDVDAAIAPPAVAIPLPNRSAYYLLDDFNHNNQHSVLAGTTDRYASTHRVCRVEGHTFASIKNRVQSGLAGGRGGASAKQIRMELLLQSEIEFEWLRQFYVQGQQHRDNHVWWHGPMDELMLMWSDLEQRIRRNTAVLFDGGGQLQRDQAALGQAKSKGADDSSSSSSAKKEQKLLRKRSEKVSRIEVQSYQEMLSGLQDRKQKRILWVQREADPIYKTVAPSAQPIKVPFPVVAEGKAAPGDLDELVKWRDYFVNYTAPMLASASTQQGGEE